jgi:hypothetical protein
MRFADPVEGRRVLLLAGLKPRHDQYSQCRTVIETELGDMAVIREGWRFNGKWVQATGYAELHLECPACRETITIATKIRLRSATLGDLRKFIVPA